MVMVYDTSIRERIASISFDEERCVSVCEYEWACTRVSMYGRTIKTAMDVLYAVTINAATM